MSINPHGYGTRVRWKEKSMRAYSKNGVGTIVPQPIGGSGFIPDGGTYVLWDALREPMACFVDELEIA